MPRSLDSRLWSKVLVGEPDECWPWQAGRHRSGHGKIKVDGRMVYAHRAAFYSCHGYWPPQINHLSPECNNPWCCNPLHLYDGGKSDNSLDMYAAGRQAGLHLVPGSKHPRATITEEVAVALYERYWRDRRTGREVAHEFRVSVSMVYNVARGHTWGHVTGHAPGRRLPKKGE
jgi:hypothetical protein